METNKENKRPRFKMPKRDAGFSGSEQQNRNDHGLEDRTYARAERVVYNYNDNPRPQRRENSYSDDSRRVNSYGNRPVRTERNSNYGRNSDYNSSGNYHSDGYKPRSYNNSGGYNNDYDRSPNTGFERPARPSQGYNRERNNNWGSNNESPMRSNNRPRPNSGNRPYNNNNNRPFNGPSRGGRPSAPFKKKPSFKKNYVPEPVEYKDVFSDPNEPIRLNKYLSNAGVCSRREADEYIKKGEVAVNGVVVTELGVKVSRTDTVTFHDQIVGLERKVYVLLNKPKNCVTTVDDPDARITVMDLVKGACHERIYPVGRLDRYTTGVLLLTNDGDLASKLTHPKFLKKKVYHVTLDKDAPISDLEKIAEGIELEDGMIQADAISYASEDDLKQIGIEIHSGKNRIVRRIFEHLGYKVHKLDRVLFAGLTKKGLGRGRWRYLTQEEVNMLKMGSFE